MKPVFLTTLMLIVGFVCQTAVGQMNVGTNLSGVVDWGPNQFVDVMKQQRTWSTRNSDGSGAWNSGLASSLTTDENGWPAEVPFDPGNGQPMQIVHTVFPVRGAGIYKLTLEGTGQITFLASGGLLDPTSPWNRSVTLNPNGGVQEFDFEIYDSEFGDGTGVVFLEYDVSAAADPIRNMSLISPGHESTHESQPFLPSYTARLNNFVNLRFMDWASTNGNPVESWTDRTRPNSFSQTREQGVALEHQVQLANQLQQDAWFCIPAQADDQFVRNTAIYLRDHLDPTLKCFVEYSNETWNGIFPQTTYVQQQGVALGLSTDSWEAGQMFVSYRSAQIWNIFDSEFGDQSADRIVKVMATHSANSFTTRLRMENLLEPSINPTGVQPDVIAIAPYFGGAVADELVDEGIVDSVTVSEILERAATAMRGFSRDSIIEHQAIAEEYDAWLITYEGGQHLVAGFANQGNEALTAKLIAANRDATMYDLYLEYLDILNDNGVVLHSNFSFINEPSRYGSWGILEDQEQPVSEAPKYRAIIDWVTANPSNNTPPVARPGVDRQFVDSDNNGFESVGFDASQSRDLDGQIVGYSWSLDGQIFGSEAVANLQLPLGVHEIELTVTDDFGESATSSVSITVAPNSSNQVLVESDFTGTRPSQNTPWTSTSQLDANANFGGWELGAGFQSLDVDDVFGFWGIFNGDLRSLEEALANDEYLSFTVQPNAGYELDLRGARMTFEIERVSYHAPRRYFVMSSVDGFTSGNELFATKHFDNLDEPVEFDFTLPFDGFQGNAPIEFRIYPTEGQWANHPASLNGFQLNGAAVLPDPSVSPQQLNILRGTLFEGGLLNLLASDNLDLSIRRSNTDIQSRVEFELKSQTSIANPSRFEFALEGSVFARSAVSQSIFLRNYETGEFELVDTRNASRFSDSTTTVVATGDLARFVEDTTGCIEARIELRSASQRQRFTANLDQAVWTIE